MVAHTFCGSHIYTYTRNSIHSHRLFTCQLLTLLSAQKDTQLTRLINEHVLSCNSNTMHQQLFEATSCDKHLNPTTKDGSISGY